MKRLDLTGKVFGELMVVDYAGGRRWSVRCSCGVTKDVLGEHLRRGNTTSCGCACPTFTDSERIRRSHAATQLSLKRFDLVGRRFGSVTVLHREASECSAQGNPVNSMWRVRCDCGGERSVRGQLLTQKKVSTCGCGRGGFLGAGAAGLNRLLATYKKGAEVRGYSWELTTEQAIALFSSPCHYCGTLPAQVVRTTRVTGNYTYNGIDRKDNALGYTRLNTLPCCTTCNRAKATMSYTAFLDYLHRISKFFGQVVAQKRG